MGSASSALLPMYFASHQCNRDHFGDKRNLGSCVNPLMSLLSTLADSEPRTFLGGCRSFRAFLTPPLPFQTSTQLDRSRPSNSDVPTEQARDHAGAAMFMRPTPGCGTLAGPSLEWVAFRSPRPNGFAESPGLKRPGALGRPKMPGSGQLTRKSPAEDMHIPVIYLSYMTAQ